MNRLTYTRPKFWAALLYIAAMYYFGIHAIFHPCLGVNFSAAYIVLMAGGMVASTALTGEGWGNNCWLQLTAGALLSAAIASLLAITSFVALTWWLSMGSVLLVVLPLTYGLASIRTVSLRQGTSAVAPMARASTAADDNDYYAEGL